MNALSMIVHFVIRLIRISSLIRHWSFVIRHSALLLPLFLTGCGDRSLDPMVDQPRGRPLRPSAFYAGESSSRTPVPGTVTRDGVLFQDELTGALVPRGPERNADVYAHPAAAFPFPMTRADLDRGRAQFTVFCTPCHGQLGDGQGMIVLRGLTPPPSYHIDRLRRAPVGHFYDVMTHGFGAMYSYNERITPPDRWRIAAYIRALQLSQNALVADLSDKDRLELTRVKQ